MANLVISGALLASGQRIITWGTDIVTWDLGSLKPTTIVEGGGPRAEGGCLVDDALVVQEGLPSGRLVIRRPPAWEPETIDRNVEMHDCLAATVDGRSGVMVLHRYAQLRFYTRTPGEGWTYRELYSIYTPSRQAGLSMTPYGLVVGNYWLRPSEEKDAPWREFAINTWNETPDSSTLRFTWIGGDLIASQGHVAVDARLARFSPSTDRTQVWNELRLGEELHLRSPHALAALGDRLVVGEDSGPGSRLYLWPDTAAPPQLLGTTTGVLAAFLFEEEVIAVSRNGLQRRPLSDREGRRRRR